MILEEIKNECEKLAQSCKGSETIIFMMCDEDGNMDTCMGGDIAMMITGISTMIEDLCEHTGKDYYEMLALMAKAKTKVDIRKRRNE